MRQTDKEMEHDIIFQEIKKDHEKYGSIDLLRVKNELEMLLLLFFYPG